MTHEGLQRDEMNDDEILIKRGREALEDLKKEWGYAAKEK